MGTAELLDKDNFLQEQINAYDNNSRTSSNPFFPTLYDFLKKSGGITFYSDLKKIKIVRKDTLSNGGGHKTININFLETIDGIDSASI